MGAGGCLGCFLRFKLWPIFVGLLLTFWVSGNLRLVIFVPDALVLLIFVSSFAEQKKGEATGWLGESYDPIDCQNFVGYPLYFALTTYEL